MNLLDEARLARHKLMTGKSAEVVQKDGRKVQYTPASLPDLERYIATLEGETTGRSFRRGPAGVSF